MKGKWVSLAVLVSVAVGLTNTSGCARSQQLVGITVSPQGTKITQSQGQQVKVQFSAFGTYIHPPETRDLTKTVIWSTDASDIISVDPTTPGQFITTGNGCGTNLGVIATVYTDHGNPNGNVVVGTATMDVSFGATSVCP